MVLYIFIVAGKQTVFSPPGPLYHNHKNIILILVLTCLNAYVF
jgi:hypothetical protein